MTEPVPSAPPPLPPEEVPALSDGRPPSYLRRHRTALVAAAVIALAFGAGFGVAAATSSDRATAAATPEPPASSRSASGGSPAPHSTDATKHPAAGARDIRATIVSVSPTSWTLTTKSGKTLQVLITASTEFGTTSAPATAAEFAPGMAIIATGTTANGTITATRIAKAAAPKSVAPNAGPTSSAAPSPTAVPSAR